jgi:transcriptional regulator with XRE-family HTH domain
MKRLRAWFESSGVTQTQFGSELDVKQATVSDWVMGITSPTFDKLGRISKRTHIPLEQLVEDCSEDVRARRKMRKSA